MHFIFLPERENVTFVESNKLLKYLEIVKFAQVENELSKHFELRDSGQIRIFFSSSVNTKTNLNNIVKKKHCPFKVHLHF